MVISPVGVKQFLIFSTSKSRRQAREAFILLMAWGTLPCSGAIRFNKMCELLLESVIKKVQVSYRKCKREHSPSLRESIAASCAHPINVPSPLPSMQQESVCTPPPLSLRQNVVLPPLEQPRFRPLDHRALL
mmetsp:Transcript_20801/g.27606  ORF Transcript_20801/g.27606 Transcript_20801/m.27606 type:complete len:132 (-) Transcript_20801:203-598(-)